MVTFNPNANAQRVLNQATNQRTTLTAFFEMNATLNSAITPHEERFMYQEFPQRYWWLDSGKKWQKRVHRFAIGRMYFVPPTAGEHFYLRTLLTAVKAPTSFENLHTYNDIIHPTFEDACRARGLLEDDGEWRLCLLEAAEMQTGARLRQLFITLLLFCEPSAPAHLWREFRESICEDLHPIIRGLGVHPVDNQDEAEQMHDYGLYLIDQLLHDHGKSLNDWPTMPRPTENWEHRTQNPLIAEQLAYNTRTEATQAREATQCLNHDQRSAFDKITTSINP
jgi:hypothetical protein